MYLTFAVVLWAGEGAFADVALPAILSSNMVLQRSTKIPIWGTAEPGEPVTVRLGEAQASGVASANGRWRVTIGPLEAGGPMTMVVSGRRNKIEVENILIGEVWVCSGQSNMAMAMDPDLPIGAGGIIDARHEIENAKYPEIRLFQASRVVAAKPQSDTKGKWVSTTPESVRDFSAVGYLFARELYQRFHVPIGMVESAWGGTPAEAWTSREALEADAELRNLVTASDASVGAFDSLLEKFQQDLRTWQPKADAAEAEGVPVAPPPPMPPDPRSNHERVSGLYNGMIAPLLQFAIRGVIWYQGEANSAKPELYRKLFPAMIIDWRRAWGQGDFPFIYAQLPNFDPRILRSWGFWKPDAPPLRWPELRESQLLALSVPGTAMAVTIDVGDPSVIHPKNKQAVAHRMALAAFHLAYGLRGPYSGPIFKEMTVQGNKMFLKFEHADGGLFAKGGPLKGFEIAGEDGKYVSANAKIVGDSVVVSSSKVATPVSARYGWADDPFCNLYNAAALPASPFRTLISPN